MGGRDVRAPYLAASSHDLAMVPYLAASSHDLAMVPYLAASSHDLAAWSHDLVETVVCRVDFFAGLAQFFTICKRDMDREGGTFVQL